MRYYFALVHKDAGSAYGVQFPDLPGVFSAADEQGEIIAKAAEALQLAAEDGDMPTPSTHEAIVARAEVRAELANGAYLIQVPLIPNDTTVVRANVSFERGMLEAIDTAAKARGMTRAAFLASAARHEIEA